MDPRWCPIKNVKRKLAGNTVHPYGPIDTTLDPHQLPLDSTFKICFTRPYNLINHIKVQQLRFKFYKKTTTTLKKLSMQEF
jgi:hypothetical protein